MAVNSRTLVSESKAGDTETKSSISGPGASVPSSISGPITTSTHSLGRVLDLAPVLTIHVPTTLVSGSIPSPTSALTSVSPLPPPPTITGGLSFRYQSTPIYAFLKQKNAIEYGRGRYGIAYLLEEDKKYKIYKVYHSYDIDEDNKTFSILTYEEASQFAQRAATYWNLTYTTIYKGDFKEFADARIASFPLDDHPRERIAVMISTFINGPVVDPCCFEYYFIIRCCPYLFCCLCCTSDLKKINQELKNSYLGMEDYGGHGNIRKYKGVPLPVDTDLIHRLPKLITKEACYFDEPLSPTSAELTKKRYPKHAIRFFSEEKDFSGPSSPTSPTAKLTSTSK